MFFLGIIPLPPPSETILFIFHLSGFKASKFYFGLIKVKDPISLQFNRSRELKSALRCILFLGLWQLASGNKREDWTTISSIMLKPLDNNKDPSANLDLVVPKFGLPVLEKYFAS